MNPNEKNELKNKILSDEYFYPLVEKTFKSSDLDGSGFIEKNELEVILKSIHLSLNIPPPTQEDIDKEFKRLDTNYDGKISKEEFSVLVRDLALFSVDNISK